MSWPVATPDGLRGGTELRAATAAWWLGACAVGQGSPIRSTAAPGMLPPRGVELARLVDRVLVQRLAYRDFDIRPTWMPAVLASEAGRRR